MTADLPFRPHHFLCALGFQGKGYSDSFTANMARVVDQLRGPDGDSLMLRVAFQADAICTPCPHRLGTGCAKSAKIARLDARHAAALGLVDDMQISWADAKARIRQAVKPGDLQVLCAGCAWLPLGLCESALASLHSENP